MDHRRRRRIYTCLTTVELNMLYILLYSQMFVCECAFVYKICVLWQIQFLEQKNITRNLIKGYTVSIYRSKYLKYLSQTFENFLTLKGAKTFLTILGKVK